MLGIRSDWPPEKLFLLYVPTRQPGTCWEWEGARIDGYGRFHTHGKTVAAHRYAWELFRAPIPDGLHIDHLCRNRGCVNPDYLEPVTQAENNRRGIRATRSHCKAGHEFNAQNTRIRTGRPGAQRVCRRCDNRRHAEWRERAAQPTEGDAR